MHARPTPRPGAARTRRDPWTIALIAAAVAVHLPGLGRPIVGEHAFRQAQTAMTAREFVRHGIDLLHPRLPVLGRPWVFAMELPLFQAIVALLSRLGLSIDAASRLLALACFVATALLLRSIARRLLPAAGATVVTAVFLFSPYGLHWSSVGLIEYLATAASLGVIVAALRWTETGRGRWIVVAAIAAAVAMAVKVTTGVFWLVPAAAALWWWGDRGRRARVVALALVGTSGIVAGAAWTVWADRLKAPHPLMAVNTSAALRTYNFGTFAQRLRWSEWTWVLDRLAGSLLLGIVWLVPASVVLVRRAAGPQRRLALACVVAVVAPVLTFFNLYRIHSYYLMAISPGLALLVGAGVWSVGDRVLRAVGTAARPAPRLVGSMCSCFLLFALGAPNALSTAQGEDPVPGLVAEIHAATSAKEPVGTIGLGWNPVLLYAADRVGVMMNDETMADAVADEWRGSGTQAVVVLDPWNDPTAVLRRWSWVGAVSAHVVRLADMDPAELPVRASWRAETVAGGRGSTVRCGVAGWRVPAGSRELALRTAAGEPLPATVRVGADGLAAFPGPAVLRLGGDGHVLRCAGADTVTVTVVR